MFKKSFNKLFLLLSLAVLITTACSPRSLANQDMVAEISTSGPVRDAEPTMEKETNDGLSQPATQESQSEQPVKTTETPAATASARSTLFGDEAAGQPGDDNIGSAVVDEMPIPYYAQSGDTLSVVASRFEVRPAEISSPDPISADGLLSPGQLLLLPSRIEPSAPSQSLLPDSEVVYGPSAVDFDVNHYLVQAGGYLSQHREYLRSTGWTSAGDIVERVALENSINPRLLLSLLEYTCGCVRGPSDAGLEEGYALGVQDFRRKGLYGQMWWAASQLSLGYYGWRDGTLREIQLQDGIIFRLAPDSNAGSSALRHYFAQLMAAQITSRQVDVFDASAWELALDVEDGLPALHKEMFGDMWTRAAAAEPLLPAGLRQPEMILPFEPDRVWVFASGPHPAWQGDGALAALDFAPATHAAGCVETDAWVVAVADGPVVRSAHGAVVQDLDHDGDQPIISDMQEQTGWAVLYMHVAEKDRAVVGTYLLKGDPLGHPSCEGGPATGTHLHIARKYNGEWILAGGPLPFVMDGWTVHPGEAAYEGTLTNGDQVIIADPWGSRKSQLTRPAFDD